MELNHALSEGEGVAAAAFAERLSRAVADVVARQQEIGIDIVNDGEYGHSMGQRYDYGAWWTYVFPRLSGLELVPTASLAMKQAEPKPGSLALGSFNRHWARRVLTGQPARFNSYNDRRSARPTVRGGMRLRVW